MRILTLLAVGPLLFFVPLSGLAHPVISEVMWMGTDLSSTDEWLEILNPDEESIDLSGWTLTYVNSSAKEIVALRFQTGTVMSPGEYLVIASKAAASSRLLAEPFAVSSTLSLLNTKLLLRLRDKESTVVDEVDDGVGVPFAGENPSGTGAKASMERIDPFVAGNLKENWRSATAFLGFDPEANVFGTPGFAPVTTVPPPPPLPPSPSPPPPPPPPPDPITCSDPLELAIAVQSGPLFAIGKATVNFQAVATEGTLTGVSCSWNYGDGFLSTSCNPPVHSFTYPGTFTVRLEAVNQCGTTLTQEQIVVVQADPTTTPGTLGSSAQPQWYDGSQLIITGVLPNPMGTDTGKEWVEIKNLEDRAVDLRGWNIVIGDTTIKSTLLIGSVPPSGTIRLYDSEIKFALPNTASKLRLQTPSGLTLSTVAWKSAEEDRVYLPDDIRSVSVRGRVASVTGPLTFMLELEGDARRVLGSDTVTVRILGLTVNEDAVVVNGEGAYEYLQALLYNRKVELQFDTVTWDELGSLLGHITVDGTLDAASQMLVSGFWTVDSSLPFAKKDDFLAVQSSLKPTRPVGTTGELRSLQDVSGIRITEVYPSPFPTSKQDPEALWKTEEWLELENNGSHAVDLTGYLLTTTKSKKPLPSGLKVVSGTTVMFSTTSIGLGLRNAGDTVSLVSPEGVVITSLEYPGTKNGMSFAVGAAGPCITIQPTPGQENVCVSPITKTVKPKAAPLKAKSPAKASARVRSYAASYRAQVEPEVLQNPAVVVRSVEKDTPWISTILVFAFGLLCSIFGLYIALKKGYVRFSFSGSNALASVD